MIGAEILVSEQHVESIASRHDGETTPLRIEEPEAFHDRLVSSAAFAE
jgi:hypothetical protein